MSTDYFLADIDSSSRIRIIALGYAIQFGGAPSDIVDAARVIEDYIWDGAPRPPKLQECADILPFDPQGTDDPPQGAG